MADHDPRVGHALAGGGSQVENQPCVHGRRLGQSDEQFVAVGHDVAQHRHHGVAALEQQREEVARHRTVGHPKTSFLVGSAAQSLPTSGDLERPLIEGWSAQVKDELLRKDIAGCVAAVASHRFADAAELASRLRSLTERREEKGEDKLVIGFGGDDTIGLTSSSAGDSTTEVRVPRQL